MPDRLADIDIADLPAPLTPADCDLRDFPFMPLHVARLRDSDLASQHTLEELGAATLLWAAAWHQVPAASLPNSDAGLTRLVGLGRDTKAFSRIKAGALHGYILCSDGRLYHPLGAQEANKAWQSKLRQRWGTECARIRKHNQRHKTNFPTPPFEIFVESGCAKFPLPVTEPSRGTDFGQSRDDGLQETETGTETGLEGKDPSQDSTGLRVIGGGAA